MKKRLFSVLAVLMLCQLCGRGNAQAFEGFALFNDIGWQTAYLVDANGDIVHSWNCDLACNYTVLLKDNGNIVRGGIDDFSVLGGAAAGGYIQELDSNANVIWEYKYSSANHLAHHDMALMPNGNVLVIAWEVKTAQEMQVAGYSRNEEKWPTEIIELAQDGSTAQIVWEWHIWDHLIQDTDTSKPNYGVVKDHPELLNINVSINGGFPNFPDMFHVNGVDYNETLDQIVFSSRFLSEIFIIDHSTTTLEAAGHTGGNSGMGGDFLYRWGNPANFGAPFGVRNIPGPVHDPRWIPDDGRPNGGWIQFFNNEGGVGQSSTVEAIDPPRTGIVYDAPNLSGYGPTVANWFHNCLDIGYGQSASDKMSNGNTFVAISGEYMYEVDSLDNLVWQYPSGPAKAFRYECDHPGIIALLGANPCGLTSRDELESANIRVFPNPTTGQVHIKGIPADLRNVQITVMDLVGNQVMESAATEHLDLSQLKAGVYLVRITAENSNDLVRKVMLMN